LPVLQALGDVGADLLRRLGFNLDYQTSDWGTMAQRLAKQEPVEQGGWSIFHTYWSGLDQLNPGVHQYLRANGREGRTGWPDSPRLEALRDEWLRAESESEQRRLGDAIQRQAFEDIPYIPTGQILPRIAHRREVTDILGGVTVFWNLRKA